MISANKNNKNSPQIKKLHNPKAHAPSAYFPAWLIQIPDSQLSLGAKMVYGRLAQWSNTKGQVHRSSNQLCHELGMSKSPVDRYLKQLRKAGLIGTFQAEKGGVNHFEFYDHEWMYALIHPNLCYHENVPEIIPEQVNDPLSKQTIPHTDIDNTPLSKQTTLKYNKIKEIKTNNKASPASNIDIDIETESKKQKPEPFNLSNLIADNPHEIEEEMLVDWLDVRKNKKNKVTPTAWKRINRTLILIEKEVGITPKVAFETMVASGWQSLELKYFQTNSKGSAATTSQGTGVKDYYGNDITWE